MWTDFFVATTGASAALTGLIFVALSVNIDRILQVAALPAWAAATIGTQPTDQHQLGVAAMPKPGLPPSYAADIMPLFTLMDREHMVVRGGFDLWKFDDVKAWAARILTTVQAGTMPPKGTEPEAPWSGEKVALFKAWMDGSCKP